MIVGKAIYYLLTNATDVTDIVSTRIYPEVAQQNADLPYIVYAIANNEPTDTKPEPSKLDTAQVEVNIYSQSYTQCIDLSVAVRAALDRVTGTYSGVNVQSIQYLNEVIDFDEPQRAYNINADYDVRISRTDFEIAQGSPISLTNLGELNDVNVSGVTDNQILSYDSATGTWIPANDSGAISLDDLSDVDAAQPTTGQLLSYGQGEWTTIDQDELTLPIGSITNLQTSLDAKANTSSVPTELNDLTDVKIVGTPSNGDALVYSSGFWSRGTAGASTLGDLSDVNLTTPSTGAYLQYDGTEWIDSVIALPSVPSIYYHDRYASQASTLRSGATATTEIYYTAQADGDGYSESASSDTATTGYDIRRKLYYSEAAQADPDTGTWIQFADIADDTTFASAKATLLAYLKARTGGTVPISLKQTWEEVAEATLLLDTYTGAAAAYSLRQLRTGETQAIRVRRASDNAEQDIGFSSGELDTSSLASFCSGTNGFVKVFYDQSGNSNDATQTNTANQPKIYDSTTGVETYNSKPAIRFINASVTYLDVANFGTESTMTYFEAHKANGYLNVWSPDGGENAAVADSQNFVSGAFYDGMTVSIGGSIKPPNLPSNTQAERLLYWLRNGANSEAGLNGTTAITGTNSASVINRIRFGTRSGLQSPFDGHFSELIAYASDQSSNRSNIESNINTFYSIY